MTDNVPITWSVLIPVKLLAQAKSRLAAFAGTRRGELALAIAGDTVAAVLDCDQAARTIVITDDPVAQSALAGLGAIVVPDEPRDGLNAALRHGAAHAAARWPAAPRRWPPTCPRCAPTSSRGRCARPRPGQPPSSPTRPETARRCTPRRPGCHSSPRSAWRRARGTRRAGPPSLTSMACPACAGTWTPKTTCVTRWRSAPAAHRPAGGRTSQMCTTGQVSVLVIPGTDWMFAATSLPSSSTFSAWARTMTS